MKKHPNNDLGSCKKCSGKMENSIAIANTYTMGLPDFPGMTANSRGQTVSFGGTGKVIPALKCERCGWSVTA